MHTELGEVKWLPLLGLLGPFIVNMSHESLRDLEFGKFVFWEMPNWGEKSHFEKHWVNILKNHFAFLSSSENVCSQPLTPTWVKTWILSFQDKLTCSVLWLWLGNFIVLLLQILCLYSMAIFFLNKLPYKTFFSFLYYLPPPPLETGSYH